MALMRKRQNPRDVYERTFREYLQRLTDIDLDGVAGVLGVGRTEAALNIPFLGNLYRVGPAGVSGPGGGQADFGSCVILLQLLLRCPTLRPCSGRGEWISFRDFPDGAPLNGFFAERVEGALLRAFTGRLSELHAACVKVAGHPQTGFTHDLAQRFEVLPQLPLLILFNDAAEELPAACSVLFQQHAALFLDTECLAMMAELLVNRLLRG
jgi:hypothetical protein